MNNFRQRVAKLEEKFRGDDETDEAKMAKARAFEKKLWRIFVEFGEPGEPYRELSDDEALHYWDNFEAKIAAVYGTEENDGCNSN